MNWYKKAALWYEFKPTVTLYHGTNQKFLPLILKEGLKPIQPQQLINSIFEQYNLNKSNMPDYLWKYELNYRQNNPRIHLTTSKDQASSYAQSTANTGYGEFEHIIIKNINE